jgi:hypothetical protein
MDAVQNEMHIGCASTHNSTCALEYGESELTSLGLHQGFSFFVFACVRGRNEVIDDTV